MVFNKTNHNHTLTMRLLASQTFSSSVTIFFDYEQTSKGSLLLGITGLENKCPDYFEGAVKEKFF